MSKNVTRDTQRRFNAAVVCGSLSRLELVLSSIEADCLVDAFVHAWNTHDGRAFGQLYADDADWVMVSRQRLKVRIAIEQALAEEHRNWARATPLRAADVIVREIDRQRAIVMFKWEIASDVERGARPHCGNSVLIVQRLAEAWVIVAGQAAAVPASK